MARRATTVLVAALLCLAPLAAHAALTPYVGTFEGFGIGEIGAPNSLSLDGWLVYGNVFNGTVWQYGYGPYPAPNDGAAFCAVTAGQGGDLQGTNQLSVYSDYNNQGAHTAGLLVEANVYHEQTVAAEDAGTTWKLQFDAKLGNLVAPTTAVAFIKTIDPNNGWAMTNFITVNTTAIPATWNTYSITIDVIPALVGQFMQFGFASTATNNDASGVIYDNIVWGIDNPTGVGDGPLAGLRWAGFMTCVRRPDRAAGTGPETAFRDAGGGYEAHQQSDGEPSHGGLLSRCPIAGRSLSAPSRPSRSRTSR